MKTPAEVLREAMGDMSQVELARRTGVTPKHVCEVLAGRSRISITWALDLELVLRVRSRVFTNAQMWADLAKARASIMGV